MQFLLFPTLLLASLASAHFRLDYPTSLGFDDDNEPNAPCGGFDIKFANNDTSVSVSGMQVAFLTTHPQGNFTYRGTVSQSDPFQWTELLTVNEMGLGEFCLPNLRAPASWAGQNGVIQVIGNLPDGTLYQCATVKFTNSTPAALNSVCKNGTVSASVISQGNATGLASATTTASTSSTSSGAAAVMMGSAAMAGLGAIFAGMAAL